MAANASDGHQAAAEAAVRRLRRDVSDFWAPVGRVARVDARSLSPLRFLREFASRNVPVVLLNAMESPQWRLARRNWADDAYLVDRAGEAAVTVDVTPFGLGDAVLELDEGDALFVMPEEREMTLREFLDSLSDREGFDGVPYLSHQNDSLRDEFPKLYEDVPPCLELAKEAFGNEPDAVNIWIGDERAVSSMHKDHYENMYCVVKGEKHFTLLPPADVTCLYEREFKSARYRHEQSPAVESLPLDAESSRKFHDKFTPRHSSWRIHSSPETGDTPWIPVDPLNIDAERYPLAALLEPIECVVRAGEVLYLPSMWYHRATQLCATISVNYWHDMEFDCRYVYYNLAREFATLAIGAPSRKDDYDEEEKENEQEDTS